MVTAWDEAGAVGRADVSIVVTADPNYSPYDWGPGTGTGGSAPGPVADAGQALRVLPGDTVTLDGSGSSGDQLVYRWRQVSGPEIELNEADTISPTFVVPAYEPEGENKIVIELAVTDAGNRTVTDQVTITIRDPEASETRVVISTNMGDFVIELDPGNAPVTVENFLQYVDDGFYDGLIFHRVIADFVIQTGGYLPGLNQSEEGDMIVNESDNGLSNVRGSVAMARTSDPHSAASQWYVNLVDNLNLDYNYETDEWGYTVFGTVIDGMEVVDRIGAVPTETRSGFNDVPVNDVIVRSATRE
ncbi:MAG: peptidylprolyl isomerase [Phycisphaerae bacterium]|nr:peptidylprolyl isomerase [Phycisphaerae bacterium]